MVPGLPTQFDYEYFPQRVSAQPPLPIFFSCSCRSQIPRCLSKIFRDIVTSECTIIPVRNYH